MKYDIAIIGGGPAGYNAAERAAAAGCRTILFEKKVVGGVCLNEGCIPTKALLHSAKLWDTMKASAKYGLQAQGISFDHSKIISRKNKIVKRLTAGVTYKLTSGGVDIVTGYAVIKGETDGYFQIECEGNQFLAHYILVCAGSETVVPPIKGLDDVSYWTSKEALEAVQLPRSLAIVGGGVIGMEFASYFNSVGVAVTVIEMMPHILGATDKEIAAMLQAEYAKKGVQFHLSAKVVGVKKGKVYIETGGEQKEITAEQLLISVGRRANTTGIGLESLHIETDKKGVKVNEYMQTSHPNVYAAGDITGFSLLAHTAIREGEVAINHIVYGTDMMNYEAIPSVVYTSPELASVGKTEEELTAKGEYCRTLKLPMTYSGRFMVENEGVNGLCKLIIDNRNCVIGCHMIGNTASELIVTAGIAIEKGFTVEEFRKIIFPHPTVGEIFHETLYD